MSNGATQASAGATYRMLRELGSRAQHSYAALREPNDLVVVQRFVRADAGAGASSDGDLGAMPLDAEAMALLLRDARCLAKNWHPNVARVRHVDLTSKPRSILTIASDFVEGSTLEDLVLAAQPERTSPRDPLLALPLLARILLDVLVGLHALHGLRDGMNAPLGAIHGELCPANVVVGKDGVARIVNVLRKRPVRVRYGSEALGYAAPEALDTGGTDDPRADVYAVGAMLWEGIAGKRLYTETSPGSILVRQREGELVAPPIHPSSPFARLADVAMRALSFDPSLRYRGPAEMAADLRKIAGTKLATGAAVAARVVVLAGERMRMRRAILEPATSGTRRRASERSIIAAVHTADTARRPAVIVEESGLAEAAVDPGAVVAVPSLPPLPQPVTPRLAQPSTRRIALPRAPEPRVAPTLDHEIPVYASPLVAPSQPAEPMVEVDVDGGIGIGSTEHLIVAALATTTAQMRAVAVERAATPPAPPALPELGTPGDFVIPIDVTETWNESTPRRRRRFLAFAALAALVLAAMGAFLAVRAHTAPGASSAVSVPLVVALPPPSATALPPRNGETSAEAETASTAASPSTSSSSATTRPAPRSVGATPQPPPARPKKSIYEPDGL